MIHDIPNIEPAYTTRCKYYEVGDVALTACFWLVFNKAIIAVSVCYGASIARRSVIVEYATIWWVVVLNLTSCCMIIALWCYYYLPLDLMKACLGISCAALAFSVLVLFQTGYQLNNYKNRQINQSPSSEANTVQQTTIVHQNAAQEAHKANGYPSQPPPAYSAQQPVAVQSVPQTLQAPTYVQLPNGQIQMVQNTAQSRQPIIVAGNPQPVVPPPPVFTAEAAQRQFQTFAMAEIFLMLMNIAFSAFCVALLNSSINYCKYYY